MIVARQFIAWIVPDERNRPVGYGMIVAWQGGLAILCDRFFVFLQTSSSQHRRSGVTIPHTVPTGLVGLFKSGADLVKRMNGRALCEHRSADPDVVAGGLERVGSGERFGSVDSGSS